MKNEKVWRIFFVLCIVFIVLSLIINSVAVVAFLFATVMLLSFKYADTKNKVLINSVKDWYLFRKKTERYKKICVVIFYIMFIGGLLWIFKIFEFLSNILNA